MTVYVLKMHFRKLPPRIISCRDFSNYHNANFINSLTNVLFEVENTKYFVKDADCFYIVSTDVLVRENNKRFMNKALSKAIM